MASLQFSEALGIDELSLSLRGQRILHDISFTVHQGEFLSLIGPNGAGKSTLLASLGGITRSQGEIRVNGEIETSRRSRARKISYAPQLDETSVPFTVSEFIALSRYPHLRGWGTFREADRACVADALQLLNIELLAHRPVNQLSGGQRQLVSLGAAIAQGGDILLLDEPATFLDPSFEEELYRVLSRLKRERRKTIIAVTHDLNRAVLASDRILALRHGRIFFLGSPSDFMTSSVLEQLFDTSFSFVPHPHSGFPMVLPGA